MVRSTITCLLAAFALSSPVAVEAQRASEVFVGGGAGATYYCIVTRCDSGTTLVAVTGYAPLPFLLGEVGLRWHECFDCGRFLIGEGSLHVRYLAEPLSPFFGVGGGVSSDPDLMGEKFGLHAAVGAWLWPARDWGLRLELRGRQVGRGDAMGEMSVILWWRLQ